MARNHALRKIGRNDPCPCGSGKKYKRCCLVKEPAEDDQLSFFLADAASLRMEQLLGRMKRSEFMKSYKNTARRIQSEVLRNVPFNCVLDGREAESLLLLHMEKLEQEIEKLCSTHSKYYWLFLSRRIFPSMPEQVTRSSTLHLHRSTFNLALLKYGNSEQGDEFAMVPASSDLREYINGEQPYSGETVEDWAMPPTEIDDDQLQNALQPIIIPKQLSVAEAVRIYQIEYLSFDYYMISATLRRLWKGGKLVVVGGTYAHVVLPASVEALVGLYDDRAKYGGLLGKFGTLSGPDILQEEERPDEFVIVVPFPNVERENVPLVFPGEEFFDGKVRGPIYPEVNPHNFVPVPVSLRPFYEKLCLFREAILSPFQFSPEEIVALLIALSRQYASIWVRNIPSRYNFFQRGYTLISLHVEFQRYLAHLYRDAYQHLFGDVSVEQATSSYEKLMDWLTYKEEDFSSIDLWNRTGVRLLLPTEGTLIFDQSAIPAVLDSIFSELSLVAITDGAIGQVRGDDFERDVEKYLKANIHDFHPWMCRSTLEFSSGVQREVDVSFLVGEALFVVECKSFSIPPAFERGEPNALQARKEKIDTAIDQVDSLSELISREPSGKNFKVPEAVTHILSMVASPFPEYLDNRSDRYFLTPTLPRVCTPEEIAEFVEQFQLAAYVSKPFVWEVSRQ